MTTRTTRTKKAKFDAYEVATTIRQQIAALSEDQIDQIPAIFAALPLSGAQRYDAFQLLDEQPGNWHDRSQWHWKLRRCRNNDSRLFDAFA